MTFKTGLIGAGLFAGIALFFLLFKSQNKPLLVEHKKVRLVCAAEEGTLPSDMQAVWKGSAEEWARLTGDRIDLVTPKNDSAIINLGWIPNRNYSAKDVKRIAHSMPQQTDASTAGLSILLLNGYYMKENEVLTRVSGISIKNRPVIALFMPAIKRYATNKELALEQSLLHELGHVSGLVNLSIPQQAVHQDHGAHCKNSDCIMHWTVAVSDSTAQRRVFCENCKDDFLHYLENS